MQDRIKKMAKERLELSTVLSQHRYALYMALTRHAESCLCHEIAVFLLERARWDQAEFIASYERFDLDG